jgi:hypothetical protein
MIQNTLDQLAIALTITLGMTRADIRISLPLASIEDLWREVLSNAPSDMASRMSCDFETVKKPTMYIYQSVNGIKFYITPLFHDVDDTELDMELDRMEKDIIHYE